MSNHKNLVFFNKEGDCLNFNYNNSEERFEGDVLFHENSTDTYKTYGIYTMEKVPSFEYEGCGLTTRKFQLFNEYGFHLYGAKYKSQSIINIEPINNDSEFYSKWIYGLDFEVKFPIGTLVSFDSPFLEFSDINRTYTVVGSKKGAVMIIGQMDNDTFETTYYSDYTSSSNYVNKTLSGVNAFGVYDYITSSFSNNLSYWNEPDFYDKYYVGKKLNIVNSELNDGVVTIDNIDLTDQLHFEYYANKNSLPTQSNLIVEVITRTDLPKIYEGSIIIDGSGFINIDPVYYPQILKNGREFKITGSLNNTNFLTVTYIPDFNGIVNTTYFATQSQVIYNNIIYQCIQAYTQSFGSQSTSFITPTNTNYWSNPTYIKVDQSTVAENVLLGQLYLTTDKYYFEYGWTESSAVTMASAAERYKNDLNLFNIDLYYVNNEIRADLLYPSAYSYVNFYHTQVGSTYSIGSNIQKYEKIIGLTESVNYELNYDISENFRCNIVFTDLDEFGLKIILNKMVYDEEIAWIYTGSVVDMERTIDRTLRNWLARNYIRLYSLGIIVELQYIGNFGSIFYNSIKLTSEYPNVPVIIDDILVGTTGNFYIEHSRVLFSNIGPYLNININDIDYGVQTIYSSTSSNISDIPDTLNLWVSTYDSTLMDYGIIVSNINNLLKFDLNVSDRRLDYSISTGIVNIPGIQDYQITNRILGNPGFLVASNEVIIDSNCPDGFEVSGFSTGMVFSINNTFYPWNNQEYNIQFLDNDILNISYQGPFWGLTNSICNSSAYITLAFDTGFGQTACTTPIGPTPGSIGGPFDLLAFSNMFSISYNPNTYTVNNYNLNSFPGTSGLVDIKYIQLSNSLYAFGDDLIVIDAYVGDYLESIMLPGNTQSVEMEFNPINSYIYCLSEQQINIVDPLINTLVANISLTSSYLTSSAHDIEINPMNGDVYVTYTNSPRVDIWSYNNLTNTPSDVLDSSDSNFPICSSTGKMVFNDFEGDMYITTDSDVVIRVNSDRTIQISYGIPGLIDSIFYEPINESIYVYGSASLWKIDNGVTQSIGVTTSGFNDIIFNNITGEMNISDISNFTRLDLNTNVATQVSSTFSYGYLTLNQFDGDVYMSSQYLNNITVISPQNGSVLYTAPMSAQTTRIVYNPERKSIWAIQPSINSVVEIEVVINSTIDILPIIYDTYEENQYGTLSPDYVPRPNMWLKTRDYIRKPRENYEGDVPVKYYWRWLSDNVPQFFMYDFSGEQLPITGSYAYIGNKPLSDIILNKSANKDISKVALPQYQQTIFDTIEHTLSYIDDSTDISNDVEPLQLFLGFKSEYEGSLRSILQLYKKEEIEFSILSDSTTNISFETIDDGDKRGKIFINESSSETFTNKGLKAGQHIIIYLKDIINNNNQYVSENTSLILKIREVYTKILIVDFFNVDLDYLATEKTEIANYPSNGSTTYLNFTIKVKDKEIGRFMTYGQTEEEDERFKIELGNVGKLINPDEVFIFKEYDILEGGIDWTILNKKRKEMLMMKHLIYPYIGAYKSIINAINYFGYNDLQLNEYYKNIDTQSENFLKLFKVEIPDIFDNSVEGWTENDFIKNTYPNDKFEGTNSFNLTYFITDKNGNNILNYSIDEVVIKLQGLKYWLKRNIIPLTHKIQDITGSVYLNTGTEIIHKLHDTRIFNIKQEMTPVTFKMNETYLMPINSGSTVYNCVLDFYTIIPGYGASFSDYQESPKPFNGSTLVLPDYFTVKIRTYKTYKEWAPFSTYNIGDKVTYYGKLYESVIDNNRVKSPRRYESSQSWSANITYQSSNLVEYNRYYYVYSGLGSTSSTTPNLDTSNWLDVTEWKQLDYEPVQTISEYRRGDNLLPFNFTIDSNIDPFVVIEVTCDNGYGVTYRDRKNYEVRGLKDLTEPYQYIDPIGPFVPIQPVY